MMRRDPETFLSILDEHKRLVYKVANSYCRHDENRKDLIQEIVLQLWLSFPKYDETYKLSTWMYRIALNTAISFYRKEHSRSRISQPLPDQILYMQEETEGETMQTELGLLQKFVGELREIDKALILLHLEGNSHGEIADILGLSPTNVSTKVHRIKQQLKLKFSTTKES